MSGLAFLIIIIALGFLYFVLLRPQKRRQVDSQRMLDSLEVGDEVVTAGGIFGTITALDEDEVRVEIAPQLQVRVARRAIGAVVNPRGDGRRGRAHGLRGRRLRFPGHVSDRRKHLILMGAIVAALVGAVLLAVPGSPIHRKPTLGLDLQGGLEVVLKAVPPKGHVLTSADMDRSVSIMTSRINKLGVASPEIRKQGSNQIVIQLAGVHDPATAARLIGKTAQLQLFDFEADLLPGVSADLNGNPIATPSLYALLAQVQKQAAKGAPEAYYLFRNVKAIVKTTKKATVKGKNGKKTTILKPAKKTVLKHTLLQGPADTQNALLKPYRGKVPANAQVLKVPANTTVVSCPVANGCIGSTATSPNGVYYYLFKYFPDRKTGNGPIPEMTGGDLVLSGTRADFGQNNNPVVLLQFTNHGSNQFERVTKDEWQRGRTKWELAGRPADTGRAGEPLRPALRDRARQPAPVDAVHRLHAEQPRERHLR